MKISLKIHIFLKLRECVLSHLVGSEYLVENARTYSRSISVEIKTLNHKPKREANANPPQLAGQNKIK